MPTLQGRIGYVRVILAASLCGVLLSGCDQAPTGTHTAHTEAAAAQTESIETIAAVVGCRPEISVTADELRTGSCKASQGEFRMATFTADEGQRAWLIQAREYGGNYLVGMRWVVVSEKLDVLRALRTKLGGTLEAGDQHAEH
ncbi:hypothetical protein ABZ721_23820 [Streptomyces sp. NPDC006733]|uniref:hypothetical protein n=1 Tax=Streptomyces sp. NPDC006733 TaxID=3155460 RepID=UPI0033D225FB